MSQDKSDDQIYSLSELEQKLHDAMKAIEIIKKGGNISIAGNTAIQKYEELKKRYDQKSIDYEELDQQVQQFNQELLELRQEKMMFEKFTTLTEDEKEKMQKARDEMKTKYDTEKQTSLEQEQEKMFLEKTVEIEQKQKEDAVKKYYKTAILGDVNSKWGREKYLIDKSRRDAITMRKSRFYCEGERELIRNNKIRIYTLQKNCLFNFKAEDYHYRIPVCFFSFKLILNAFRNHK